MNNLTIKNKIELNEQIKNLNIDTKYAINEILRVIKINDKEVFAYIGYDGIKFTSQISHREAWHYLRNNNIIIKLGYCIITNKDIFCINENFIFR